MILQVPFLYKSICSSLSFQHRVPCKVPVGQFGCHGQGGGSTRQTGEGAYPDGWQVLQCQCLGSVNNDIIWTLVSKLISYLTPIKISKLYMHNIYKHINTSPLYKPNFTRFCAVTTSAYFIWYDTTRKPPKNRSTFVTVQIIYKN